MVTMFLFGLLGCICALGYSYLTGETGPKRLAKALVKVQKSIGVKVQETPNIPLAVTLFNETTLKYRFGLVQTEKFRLFNLEGEDVTADFEEEYRKIYKTL